MSDVKEAWQVALKERGDRAHALFCSKGWDIQLLENTKKRHGTFRFDSLNEFAHALLAHDIQEAQVSPDSLPYSGGKFSPEYYPHDYYFHLKPIAELVQLDIERYGEWAYLMWDILMLGDAKYEDYKSNAELLRDIDEPLIDPSRISRKLYANVPFNLGWAKAGVAAECKIEGCYEICDFVQINSDTDISVMCGEVWMHGVDFKAMRHPFPPVVE